MLEFIKIAYMVSVPILLAVSWRSSRFSKYSINLLAVTNLLLIGNAIFMIRQLVAFYRMADYLYPDRLQKHADGDYYFTVRVLLIIVAAFLTLHSNVRKNWWFSLVMLLLLYSLFPIHTWNGYDLLIKILMYGCLLCTAYALLWLLKKLPYQSHIR